MRKDSSTFEIYFQSFPVDEVLNIIYPLSHLRNLSKQLKPISYILLKFKLFKLIQTKPYMCIKCNYCINNCFKLNDYSKYDLIRISEIIRETEKLNKDNNLREKLGKFLKMRIYGFISFLPQAINYQNWFNCKILKKLFRKEIEFENKLEQAYLIFENIKKSQDLILKLI